MGLVGSFDMVDAVAPFCLLVVCGWCDGVRGPGHTPPFLPRTHAPPPPRTPTQIKLTDPHSNPTRPLQQIAEKRKARLAEAGGGVSARLCRICKVKIDPQRHYCNDCAYKKVRGLDWGGEQSGVPFLGGWNQGCSVGVLCGDAWCAFF